MKIKDGAGQRFAGKLMLLALYFPLQTNWMLGSQYSHSECDGKQWSVQLEYRSRSEVCSVEVLPKVMLTLAAGTNHYEDEYCVHVFLRAHLLELAVHPCSRHRHEEPTLMCTRLSTFKSL
jgi:hypothetical protein